MIYFLFKFIHIAGAIIWIGSVFTLGILTHRVTKKEDHAGAAALAQQSELFGRAVIGPSAMLTLISGIVMVAVYGMGTDRKSTRLNSSHVATSYAVFCLKKIKTSFK